MSAWPGSAARARVVRSTPRWPLHIVALALAVGLVAYSARQVGERIPAPAAEPAQEEQPQLRELTPTPGPLPVVAALKLPAPATPTAEPTPTPCIPSDEPLPAEDDPVARDFWRAFEAPLPPAPVWNPPGPKRVGIQAGHWLRYEVPWELHQLDFGGSGGGREEWEVTLDLAQRVRRQLEAVGVQVDLLPVAVPERYHAHAFVAIHADASVHPSWRGYKIARPLFSAIPGVDDRFVADLQAAYAQATDFPFDADHVSNSMRAYYAFNSRRYCHSVAPGVPQAIIETGYLTNADDRAILFDDPDTAAGGITEGVLRFLGLKPSVPGRLSPR